MDQKIRDYEARLPAETAASHAVAAALAAVPVDVETLKRYAGLVFDSWCGRPGTICGCAYCRARRALATIEKKT